MPEGRRGPRRIDSRKVHDAATSRDGKPRHTTSDRRRGGHAAKPREVDPRPSRYEPVHVPDEVVAELKATARPGKGDILVKVYADAAAAFQADDFGAAIRLLDQAKHIALRSIGVRELLGLAYYRAGRWNEATRELGAFRRIAGSKEQNAVLADAYRALRNPDKALELCREVKPADVDTATYFETAIVAAGALSDMGRLDDAIGLLERLDLKPEVAEAHHLRAWYVLADLLARKGRFTQALDLFEAVAAADPDATDAPERAAKLRP
ncbi:MAG TPA: tetratricopeptide repeat protein [Actinomycetota bacterium]|nr:tetratricopeptide repeat protein [Actinomycetota bacterium]